MPTELLTLQNLSSTPKLQQLNGTLEHKKRKKWIQRIANNLAFALQIPEGDQLTFILGYGECHSNHQALYAWVEEQIESHHLLEKENNQELFDTLKQQLQWQLSTTMDDYHYLMVQGGF